MDTGWLNMSSPVLMTVYWVHFVCFKMSWCLVSVVHFKLWQWVQPFYYTIQSIHRNSHYCLYKYQQTEGYSWHLIGRGRDKGVTGCCDTAMLKKEETGIDWQLHPKHTEVSSLVAPFLSSVFRCLFLSCYSAMNTSTWFWKY